MYAAEQSPITRTQSMDCRRPNDNGHSEFLGPR